MARPGIMLYFDMLEPIKVLADADKGRLLVAMLEYGQYGVEPAFDGMLALTWRFVKPKLDKDSEVYYRTVLKRQYATFCRDRKKKGEPDITFDEWMMEFGNQNQQMVSHDTKWSPTTTTTDVGRTPELDFEKLWEQYPEERRGNRQKAAEAFRGDITSVEDADQAMENLELWKRSEQWHKAGGQFIPYMDNWFSRGLWRTRPKKLVISGPRELDAEELEAIQRMLKEGNHEA